VFRKLRTCRASQGSRSGRPLVLPACASGVKRRPTLHLSTARGEPSGVHWSWLTRRARTQRPISATWMVASSVHMTFVSLRLFCIRPGADKRQTNSLEHPLPPRWPCVPDHTCSSMLAHAPLKWSPVPLLQQALAYAQAGTLLLCAEFPRVPQRPEVRQLPLLSEPIPQPLLSEPIPNPASASKIEAEP
jgi:hypothetical protein